MAKPPEFVLVICDFCSAEVWFSFTKRNHRERANTKLAFCNKSCMLAHQKKKFEESLAERFWNRVNKETGQGPNGDCWEWKGKPNKGGYGIFRLFGHSRVATWTSYYLTHGIVPDFQGKGELIGHHCDNPPCVRPEHLFLTDTAGNAADRDAKGRQIKGEEIPNSKFTVDKVNFIRSYAQLEGLPKQKTYQKLAKMFDVGETSIRTIVKNQSWRHLPPVITNPTVEQWLQVGNKAHLVYVPDDGSEPTFIPVEIELTTEPKEGCINLLLSQIPKDQASNFLQLK